MPIAGKLLTHLRPPAFKGLQIGRENGLDAAKQAFCVGAIGLVLFAIRGFHRKGGTSCTRVRTCRMVTAEHCPDTLPWVCRIISPTTLTSLNHQFMSYRIRQMVVSKNLEYKKQKPRRFRPAARSCVLFKLAFSLPYLWTLHQSC